MSLRHAPRDKCLFEVTVRTRPVFSCGLADGERVVAAPAGSTVRPISADEAPSKLSERGRTASEGESKEPEALQRRKAAAEKRDDQADKGER